MTPETNYYLLKQEFDEIVLGPKKSVNYVLEAKCSLESDTITVPIETNYYLLKINFYVFFLFIYLDVVVMIARLTD